MSDIGSGDEGLPSQKYHGQGMDAGGNTFDSGQQPQEQELATKMLQIQSKRFYLDVKQNRRGRFIKVAEIGADGRRSQIFLAMSTAAEFRDHLSGFSDYYASLGPPNPDNVPDDGKLKSEMMLKDNRRYYLDLKENSRGRFLRVSQTITRGGPRSQVKSNFRTAITVPEKCWARFRDILADYCDKMSRAAPDAIQVRYKMRRAAPDAIQVRYKMRRAAPDAIQVRYKMRRAAPDAIQVRYKMRRAAPDAIQVRYKMRRAAPDAIQVRYKMRRAAPDAIQVRYKMRRAAPDAIQVRYNGHVPRQRREPDLMVGRPRPALEAGPRHRARLSPHPTPDA
ncbi:hypothetical protein MSG28_011346 [Choristoneura fumiferana]|uniref:Uncharacterized protein n=2 Tax=Choristoneura fumiferana TaxID=7141 RepID=A0ACC0JMX7_CHOFU|nr:hypothetical protein MSG28_011346 [Choristoneura fumiferana]KAI8425514.1 hypothetical protein MSG28_011346 [Choristoneura fumiferana]